MGEALIQVPIEKLEENYASDDEETDTINEPSLTYNYSTKDITSKQDQNPVNIYFSQKTGIRVDQLAFSQRRMKGFRNFTELDHRRFLVTDHDTVRIFGYTREFKVTSSMA